MPAAAAEEMIRYLRDPASHEDWLKIDIFSRIRQSKFRMRFQLKEADIEYIREKNSKGKKIYDKKSLRLYEDDKISLQNVATRIEQLLFSLNEENSQTYSSDSYDAVVFKNAVKFMNVNIQKQLSIDELAQKCNISPTGLKNIFSKYAGLGIHKYFLKLKINHAVHLLKQGVSVTQISEILGYSSQGYFSHAFKRETGKNPSEYMVDLAGE